MNRQFGKEEFGIEKKGKYSVGRIIVMWNSW